MPSFMGGGGKDAGSQSCGASDLEIHDPSQDPDISNQLPQLSRDRDSTERPGRQKSSRWHLASRDPGPRTLDHSVIPVESALSLLPWPSECHEYLQVV